MSISEAVFRYLDDGTTTLVFPTENTARHFLAKYVRNGHTSVLASRAMALDTFMQKFCPKHEQKPSNKYHRLAFVASFLDSHDTGLGYLYKDDFYSYRQRFVSFLARILPSLADMESTGIESDMLFHDLTTLKRSYTSYLERNNLFEPGWERYSLEFCNGLSGTYVLVGYDVDIQMQKFMKQLGSIENIRTLNIIDGESVSDKFYLQYPTEEAELTALFEELNTLKLKKVPIEQIVITTPKLEELTPRLERKALEYDIPLSFVKSLKLTDTIPGRYLFAVRRCINENLSFHSVENLLLNNALPFKDMEANRTLIRFMIDQNHQGGTLDYGEDRLQKDLYIKAKSHEELAEALSLYKDLKSALGAIRSAHDGDEIIKDIHGLTARLLGNDEFDQGNEQDRDVYSFIFSELGSINRTLKESG
ncbi:MAG: hypothetical protein MJ057_09080, partial [Sphaerochaetaceae bacterium]|nr:hypothetical protein [Sphaerochaetaceae bacterium]